MNTPIQPRQPLLKIKPPMTKTGKVRTTLCLPESMLQSLHQAMDEANISRKRRSQWIEAAVESLLQTANYEELILEEFIDSRGNTTISVSLDKAIKAKIDKLVSSLDKQSNYSVESSRLLRTAISQLLIKRQMR